VLSDKLLLFRNAAVTTLVVCGFLLFDFFAPTFVRDGGDWVGICIFGIFIAQLNLIAVWAALAPGNVILRVPCSLLLCLLMWYSLLLGNYVAHGRHPFGRSDALFLGAVLVAGEIATQVPMWIAGSVFGWRLTDREADHADVKHRVGQFELKHLLLGMLLFSLAVAPTRVALPPEDGGLFRLFLFEVVAVLFILAACNLVFTVPCVWGAFMRFPEVVFASIGWLMYCAILSAVVVSVTSMLLKYQGNGLTAVIAGLFAINVSQCVTVFGTLLVFRALGFRLQRGKV
jgi:hypothetical protein